MAMCFFKRHRGTLLLVALIFTLSRSKARAEIAGYQQSLLEIKHLLSNSSIASFTECVEALNVDVGCSEQSRSKLLELLSMINSSLRAALQYENSLCRRPIHSSAAHSDTDSRCPVTSGNRSHICQNFRTSAALLSLSAEARKLTTMDACQPQGVRSYHDNCDSTGSPAAWHKEALNIARRTKSLLQRFAFCKDHTCGANAMINSSNISCIKFNDQISKLSILEKSLGSRSNASSFLCQTRLALKRTGDFIQNLVDMLRPGLSWHMGITTAFNRILCYDIIQGNEIPMRSDICYLECLDAAQTLPLLPFFHNEQGMTLKLVGTAIQKHCSKNLTSAEMSRLPPSQSYTYYSQLPRPTAIMPCKYSYCVNWVSCQHPFKATAEEDHRASVPQLKYWIETLSTKFYPNTSQPVRFPFPCGLNCQSDTTSGVYVVTIVTYSMALIVTGYVQYVVLSHRSQLHLGRRFSGWLNLAMICSGIMTPLSFAKGNCHSDDTVRLKEPSGLNTCSIFSLIEAGGVFSAALVVLGIGYTFHRMIKLSNNAQGIKSELIENAYKVEIVVGVANLLLFIPYAVVIAKFKLIQGHPTYGWCFINNDVAVAVLICLYGTACFLATMAILVGLPKFLHLIQLSKKIAAMPDGIRRSFRGRKQPKQKCHRYSSEPAALFLIEVMKFSGMCAIAMVIIMTLFSLALTGHKWTFDDHQVFYLCALASCDPERECSSHSKKHDKMLQGAHITFNICNVLLSWWTFKRRYYRHLYHHIAKCFCTIQCVKGSSRVSDHRLDSRQSNNSFKENPPRSISNVQEMQEGTSASEK